MHDSECAHAPSIYPLVHFDVPTAAGRQIFSIQCCGRREVTVSPPRGSGRPDQLAGARRDSGPVIVVFVGRDGEYFTDYASPGMDQLMRQVLSFLPRHEEKHTGGTDESAQMLEQLDVSSLKDLLHTSSLEESSTSMSSSSIWLRTFNDWGIEFYVRVDRRGCFHTYPRVGGPFHSLPEAYGAIDCYLRDHEDPTLRIDKDDPDFLYQALESTRERAIRRILCWPDGTRKLRLQSVPIDERRCRMLQMVRALVDKYNDDHNLPRDLAYEVQGIVCYHVFNEGNSRRVYYHVNFTAKTKDIDNLLFFAETMTVQRDELVVSCICRVNPFDKDMGYCHGCRYDVKHPKDDAFTGGHSSAGCLSSTYHSYGPRDDFGVTAAELQEEEARVRYLNKAPRDPNFLETLRTPVKVNYLPPRSNEEALAFISRFFK